MDKVAGPPTPFGKAWLRPVEIRTPELTVGGVLISGRAGRDKPAILGFPGSFRPIATLYALARALAADFDLLLVDYPGFGATSVAEPPSIDGLVARAAAMAEVFLPGRALFALGESIGGVAALALAAGAQTPLEGVASLDPPLSARALAKARGHLRASAEGLTMSAYFRDWLDGPGVMGDGTPDGYFPLLDAAAARTRVLIVAGGRRTGHDRAAPATLFDDADAARATAAARVVRFARAGHLVAEEAAEAGVVALRGFFRARAVGLAALAADPAERANLLVALRDFVPGEAACEREALLAVATSAPDDAELAAAIFSALYAGSADAAGIAALDGIAAHARDAAVATMARVRAAASVAERGDHAAALGRLAAAGLGEPPAPAIASLELNMALYAQDADDLSIARAKAKFLATARAHLGEVPTARARATRTPGRPRIGFVSGAFGSRNYMSLMVPFLRALARHPVELRLMSPIPGDFAKVEAALPPGLAVRDLGAMPAAAQSDPAAWARTAEALAAEDLDLLVDLDEALMPYSPACVSPRPARAQVTWFNMTGPSDDPCFDACVGPAPIYPPELAAAFPGRILGLPADLYVFEPELWATDGMSLPPPGPPPFARNGYPTFGSLSHPYKIGRSCVALWAKVLRAIPEARLHLGNGAVDDADTVERLLDGFAREGVAAARIDFSHRFGWPSYLAGYAQIDVVLGTHPVAGGTTIFEAAHMGLPVLSRAAPTSLGRIGAWLEAATGRPGVAHTTDDSFVAEAVRLAHTPGELAALRDREPARLREKSRADAPRMAEAFLTSIAARFGLTF